MRPILGMGEKVKMFFSALCGSPPSREGPKEASITLVGSGGTGAEGKVSPHNTLSFYTQKVLTSVQMKNGQRHWGRNFLDYLEGYFL